MKIAKLRRYWKLPKQGSTAFFVRFTIFATLINFALVFGSVLFPNEHASLWGWAFSHPTDSSAVLVAIFNGMLVYVTYRLVASTNRLWAAGENQIKHLKTSAKAARTAAEAATRQAQISISAELPRPVIHRVELRRPGVSDLEACLQANHIVVYFKNYGRSPAFLNRQCIDLIVCGILPDVPLYQNVITFDVGTIIERGRTFELDRARLTEGEILMRASDIESVLVYVFGFVEYRDFMNKHHIYRFCKCLVTPRSVTNLSWYDGPFLVPDAYTASD